MQANKINTMMAYRKFGVVLLFCLLCGVAMADSGGCEKFELQDTEETLETQEYTLIKKISYVCLESRIGKMLATDTKTPESKTNTIKDLWLYYMLFDSRLFGIFTSKTLFMPISQYNGSANAAQLQDGSTFVFSAKTASDGSLISLQGYFGKNTFTNTTQEVLFTQQGCIADFCKNNSIIVYAEIDLYDKKEQFTQPYTYMNQLQIFEGSAHFALLRTMDNALPTRYQNIQDALKALKSDMDMFFANKHLTLQPKIAFLQNDTQILKNVQQTAKAYKSGKPLEIQTLSAQEQTAQNQTLWNNHLDITLLNDTTLLFMQRTRTTYQKLDKDRHLFEHNGIKLDLSKDSTPQLLQLKDVLQDNRHSRTLLAKQLANYLRQNHEGKTHSSDLSSVMMAFIQKDKHLFEQNVSFINGEIIIRDLDFLRGMGLEIKEPSTWNFYLELSGIEPVLQPSFAKLLFASD